MAKMLACAECGEMFEPKTYRHIFHARKCFRTFNRRKKLMDEGTYFACPDCGKRTKLKFDPRKNGEKWRKFHCPFCGYSTGIDAKEEGTCLA